VTDLKNQIEDLRMMKREGENLLKTSRQERNAYKQEVDELTEKLKATQSTLHNLRD
jgi:hypothetical protein